jgi:acetyltransferase-like isoleucine patch superfamily enzyme
VIHIEIRQAQHTQKLCHLLVQGAVLINKCDTIEFVGQHFIIGARVHFLFGGESRIDTDVLMQDNAQHFTVEGLEGLGADSLTAVL